MASKFGFSLTTRHEHCCTLCFPWWLTCVHACGDRGLQRQRNIHLPLIIPSSVVIDSSAIATIWFSSTVIWIFFLLKHLDGGIDLKFGIYLPAVAESKLTVRLARKKEICVHQLQWKRGGYFLPSSWTYRGSSKKYDWAVLVRIESRTCTQ